jgi:NADH-quinone oxidoreductase subunit J
MTSVSTAPLWLFWILGGLAILGALATVTRRNAVVAVVTLVGTFFCVAGVYALMSAHFLAILQVLVYAGAIMVLFTFVVMLLGREETEPWSLRAPVTRALGVLALGYLAWVFLRVFLTGAPALPPPAATDFGTVAAVGRALLTDLLFPFELISLLLLVAVIGAMVVARNPRPDAEAAGSPAPAAPAAHPEH